ncbi:MAG: MerR family transcriptional regulator [Actinomycetota bacterium]|nr:MerR family transcriptional regulator [Actinomycetota bacterium]
MRTVGEVSELAGVSVRALHHYDEVGLLSPSGRSDAGYRLYSHADLSRLQEILVWRQLGLSLAEIRAVLDEACDRVHVLRRQRELVGREVERLSGVAMALDAAIATEESGVRPEEETMFEGLDHSEFEDEARERWGDTAAYRESARRTAAYGAHDWDAIQAEAQEIVAEFADLMRAGERASGEPAVALAERHRRHIARWFYPCLPDQHRALGEMYVADQRFARKYDSVADGLAAFVRDAIAASADKTPAA